MSSPAISRTLLTKWGHSLTRLSDLRSRKIWGSIVSVALLVGLTGCITVGPDFDPKQATAVPDLADHWTAAQPHGASLRGLNVWWDQFNDPLLLELIDKAQVQSSTMADAALRIAQARALLVSSNAAALPDLSAQGLVSRGTTIINSIMLGTTSQAQAQATWELDLFGALKRNAQAAQARLTSEVFNWHSARISLAADTANHYTNYRACEQMQTLAERDAKSREATAKLTDQLASTGFQSPANAALARASAAEGAGRAVAQKAECDLTVKALVALTGIPEADLRLKLASNSGQLPQPVDFEVRQLPAQVLSQRPDVASAEQQLAAASADIGVRIAERLPRLALTGNVGPFNFSSSEFSLNGGTWSIGPSLSLPLFDAGRRAANEDTAWVAYQTAETKYRSQVRLAVREVEQALVSLDSLRARDDDALIASEGYHVALHAAEQKYNFGLASVLDLEETRRLSFNADNILMSVRRDHVNAWIALYRAVGGGWQAAELAQAPSEFLQETDQKGKK